MLISVIRREARSVSLCDSRDAARAEMRTSRRRLLIEDINAMQMILISFSSEC